MLKSLEVINAKIESLKQQRENRIEEFKLFNDDDAGEEIILLDSQISELKQIKLSLEVLEILNKYIKVEHYKPIGYKEWKRRITMSVYEEIPVNYFGVTEDLHQFTKEELLKIESWIKSNQVGDNHD